MTQITREEITGWMGETISIMRKVQMGWDRCADRDRCADKGEKIIAALQAAEPVAYLRKDQLHQIKTRGPAVGEIAAEPRSDRIAVYALPCPPAKAQVPDAKLKLKEALDSVEDAMKMAYNSAYPECCGRHGHECCGSPEPAWLEEDQKIMDALDPVQKILRSLITASPAPEHIGDGNEMVEILKWIASGETAKGCYDGSDEVGAIRERVASFLARHHRQGGAER